MTGVGQLIVSAYGFSPTFGGDSNLTRLYNINKNSWSLGLPAPLPPRSEEAYGETAQDGFVYVIGGRSSLLGVVLNNLEQYDPVMNTWTTLTPMPTPRAAAAAAVIDDSIYVAGGRTSGGGPCTGGELSVVERYDVDTDTWSEIAPLPSPRSDAAAQAHGGKVYVFGGCSGGQFLSEVLVYNPETNSWSSRSPMPTPRASLAAGIDGEDIYAIGGYAGGAPLNVNEVYNIPSGSWSAAAPMINARGEAGVHSHGGRIYVVGGSLPAFGNPTDANEVFKPNP